MITRKEIAWAARRLRYLEDWEGLSKPLVNTLEKEYMVFFAAFVGNFNEARFKRGASVAQQRAKARAEVVRRMREQQRLIDRRRERDRALREGRAAGRTVPGTLRVGHAVRPQQAPAINRPRLSSLADLLQEQLNEPTPWVEAIFQAPAAAADNAPVPDVPNQPF